MLKAGIIDPTKVTRIALENAASVAGMLLTTECVLADIKVVGLTAGGHWFEERSSQSLIDAGAYTVVKTYDDLIKILQEL